MCFLEEYFFFYYLIFNVQFWTGPNILAIYVCLIKASVFLSWILLIYNKVCVVSICLFFIMYPKSLSVPHAWYLPALEWSFQYNLAFTRKKRLPKNQSLNNVSVMSTHSQLESANSNQKNYTHTCQKSNFTNCSCSQKCVLFCLFYFVQTFLA